MYQNELQQAIRFAIGQLSAQNSQSDFEKICLFFSRARINKNVLPATGPVQAGGDQGRDFETFVTYLHNSQIGNSTFIGMFSKFPVAFACSLEKKPTSNKGKIFSDVQTIMSSGTKIERIYFFSGEDIPVAKRHKSIESIKQAFNVSLEIIDAQGLSLHLCDSDLFWIAIQFLKIPMQYSPKPPEGSWYANILDDYKKRNEAPKTFQEFAEVQSAVRHVYKDENLKSDLIFWLRLLDTVINSNEPFAHTLKRKAIYEKFVASLIGLNNIDGQEQNLKKYFEDFEVYASNAEIADAQVLLSFSISSKTVLGHELEDKYLEDLQERMEKLLLTRIAATDNIDSKCALIESHANFIFIDSRSRTSPVGRITSFSARLSDVLPLLSMSHYYPIERLSRRVNSAIESFLEIPGDIDITAIETIAKKLDEFVATKGGREQAGEIVRDRALLYQRKGEIFKAIACLHEAKIKWYNEEAIRGSILSCLMLGKNYSSLGMDYAAKYHAFLGAYFAINSHQAKLSEYFLQGLSIVAGCDYHGKSWFHYIDLLEFLINMHFQMTKDFDLYDHDDAHKIIYYPAIILHSARILLPAAKEWIEKKINNWGFIKEDIHETVEKVNTSMPDAEALSETLNDQLSGRIFNDVGSLRKINFNASGINWEFSFSNDYDTNALAEEFIAMVQIILCELHHIDLHLIRTDVKVRVKRVKAKESTFKILPSNEDSLWEVNLVMYEGSSIEQLGKHEFHYLVIAQALLLENSMLTTEEYQQLVGAKLKDGSLLTKITFGRPYADLYKTFYTLEAHTASKRNEIENLYNEEPFEPAVNKKMPWNRSISPKYNKTDALLAISNRVKNASVMISKTLPLLNKSSEFLLLVKSLRSKAWLDWQILQTVATIVINYKARFTKTDSQEIVQEKFQRYLARDESETYEVIPISIFFESRIEDELKYMLTATLLPSFGLELRTRTVKGAAVIDLLRTRFNYSMDGGEIRIFET